MKAGRRERIEELMARMGAGDRAAVFSLYEEFGAAIAAAMRRHLRRLGVGGVARAELDGLVIDACLELLACAHRWNPDGGALPWTWAARRLHRLASGWVGQHANSLDGEQGAPVTSRTVEPHTQELPPLVLLEKIAGTAPLCSLLRDALGQVASERDAAILLEYRTQVALGDPAPARTVGSLFGMRPPAVRKVVQRSRDRLRRLASRDDRFQPLIELPLLA